MTGSSADVDNYVTCLQDKRLSTYFIYVATTLYFYDFCLTFGAELCHVWQRRKPSLRNVLYLTARYCGFASAIAGTLPWTTLTLGNAITSLRLITIVASETILVHRTWVLWQHNKFVKRLLVATCIGSLAPCIFVVYEDIISEGVETSRPTPEINADDICSFLVSNATSLWIIPYIMSIFLELGFSIFNILLVMSVSRPQLRNGGSQLQTLLHSIISSRVVLHLASVLDNSGHPSLSTPRTKLQFASNHRPIEGGSSVYSSSPSSGNPNV
ncbi:hypothetical protein CCMSSC00406_0002258 [Pleurotus cornucopiae]|uniref:Uncharacterized protein n=1 Tax=Pleurotus cornucopiae TaxID=5321 RepID=A0ACB7J3B1_PLECO|nr:hypothetical protein CCMSSC00406_0002258 [Pleurotus cornucopiae]